MSRKLTVEPAVVLKSAAIMFLVPVPFLLTVLLVIGVAQFYLTGDVGVAFEHAKAFRLSPGNLWLSDAAYIGALDDYRYLQFPFVLVVTAFAGFHLGCWHYRGAHIKR